MYIPPKFKIEDSAVIHDFIRQHSFGLLLTLEGQQIHDTHTPFHLDEQNGCLWGHIAKANPQWKAWNESTQAKVIFTGPHTYISPGYYASEINVPTWNYTAVSVTGRLSVVTNPDDVLALLDQLTVQYEPKESAWTLDRNNERYMNLLSAIVVFKVSLDSVEASFKLNQNKATADQESVIAALSKSNDVSDQQVAAMMKDRLSGDRSL